MSTAFPKRDQRRVGYLSDLLNEVDEQWHAEFEQFVETGEANDAFLSYLDQNERAQHAVEVAFERQAAKFEELARELKNRQPKEEINRS